MNANCALLSFITLQIHCSSVQSVHLSTYLVATVCNLRYCYMSEGVCLKGCKPRESLQNTILLA